MQRLAKPQRPARQVAAMGFAAGVMVAWIVSFFFDSQKGEKRRRVAYESVIGTGRDLGLLLGNKAMDAMFDWNPQPEQQPSQPVAGTGA